MRIVVVDIAARGGGANTILEGLYQHAVTRGTDHQWIFLLGERYLPDTANAHTLTFPAVRAHWGLRLGFDFLTGGRIINRLRPDAVLSLQNTTVSWLTCPQVLYLHQSLPFFNERRYSFLRPEERRVALYQRAVGLLIRRSARHADHVVVQTEVMKAALKSQLGVECTVAPPPIDVMGVARASLDPTAFLYPTADWPYKNTRCLTEACALLHDMGVTLATTTITIPSGPPAPGVRFVGPLPRVEVLQLLARSTLVFPSLVESYPLPLAEGRALGIPILASDRPFSHEVLRNYPNVRFFDPSDPAALAGLMRDVIEGSQMMEPVLPSTDGARDSWAEVLSIARKLSSLGTPSRIWRPRTREKHHEE